MNKLRILARKCAALLLLLHFSVQHKCSSLLSTVQLKCSSFFNIVRCISLSKTPIYRSSQCSSSNTSPDFDIELEISVPSWMQGDDFDHEDFDEWWENEGCEDFDGEFGDCDEVIEEYWEGSVYNTRRSWIGRSVDEAIDEEKDNGYRSYYDRT